MGSKNPPGPAAVVADSTPDVALSLLELVDYAPARSSHNKLPGGAYDPYESPEQTGDTVRLQKPRTDLRKLSAWIKQRNEGAANPECATKSEEKPLGR